MATENTDLLTAARDAAAAGTDLYGMLGVDASATKEEIHRAWRRTGLKHHPDKARERFDRAAWEGFERARSVLTDDGARLAYDTALAAAMQRKVQAERMGAERRRFKDELEAAERAASAGGKKAAGAGAADAEREALREAGRRRAEERARHEREAEEREEKRREDRIRELEDRLKEKEDKARRRAGRKAGAAGDETASATHGAAAAAKAARPEADGQWRQMLGGDEVPFTKRPIYAYTLARMKAAGARRRERLQAEGKPAPDFVPRWQEVTDPEVKKFIARVPVFGPPPAAEDVEMETAA
jgi:DnaJ homolog subfamily C member 17